MNHNGKQFGLTPADVRDEMQSKLESKYGYMRGRKGTTNEALQKRADEQRGQEDRITSRMSSQQRFERDVKSGVQGARNVVNLNTTVQEAMDNPDMLGGPVSGDALAKLKRMKGIK